MDFGLAKISGSTRVTKSGMTVGTVDYMSPEQVRGEEVDQRTDIWSFGVVLYEMLTGRRPFAGDYEQAVMYSIMNEEPRRPSSLTASLPPAADALVGKALARNRDQRYRKVDDLIRDLESLDSPPVADDSRARGSAKSAAKRELPALAVLPYSNI
jgi:serine/threonine-protein kinase